MIPPIFQDPEQQKRFDLEGFVVIPFLTKDEIASLLGLFERLHEKLPENAFTSSSYTGDLAYKTAINDGIRETFAPNFARVFREYTALGGAFLYKTPGPKSELFPHQDWTIVDETRAVAINVWVPLTPVDEMNGTLHVLPGSHRYFQALRAPTLPTMYAGHEKSLIENTVPLLIQHGEAVALNQALFHYSPSNRSAVPRIAITAAVKTRGEKLRFHYRAPGASEIEVWEQEDDFLNQFTDFAAELTARPARGKRQGTVPFNVPKLDRSQIDTMVARMREECGVSNTLETPLLRNHDKEERLTRYGFAVLDLLSSTEVESLLELYRREHPGPVSGFMASVHLPDKGVRRRVNDGIAAIMGQPLERAFCNYRGLGGSFIVKGAGHREPLQPHQDWSIVEEDRFRSLNLWIALSDVDESNGAIRVLPGSHLRSTAVRGPNIPSTCTNDRETLWNATQSLVMRAGQVLAYDHRLIHASGPNLSAQPRIAAVFGLTHRFAELRYFYLQDQQIAVYRSHVRFMVEGNPPAGPGELELLRTTPFAPDSDEHAAATDPP